MNIIIVSHRRSGTHLTIDALLNNLPHLSCKTSDYIALDFAHKDYSFENFKQQLTGNCVVKTHILPDFSLYNLSSEEIEYYNRFFNETKKIYVFRNGLDVMVSLYFYMKNFDEKVRKMSFGEFLRTPVVFESMELIPPKLWAFHVESWLNSPYCKDCYKVKYEDLVTNYELTLRELIGFILPHYTPDKLIDVRLKSNIVNPKLSFFLSEVKKKLRKITGVRMTSVSPRKGAINDYVNYFSDEDYRFFFEHAENAMKLIGYGVDY